MKIRKSLLIAGSLIVLGGIFFVIGSQMGGAKTVDWRNGRPQVSKMISSKIVLSSKTNSLKIDTSDVEVEIKKGNEFLVESQLMNQKPEIQTSETGLTTISSKGMQNVFNLTINFNFSSENMKITVPSDLKTLELVTDNGSVQVLDLAAEKMTVKISDGKLDFENVKSTGEVNLTASNSKISLQNVQAKTLAMSTADSSSTVKNLSLGKTSTIDIKDSNLHIQNTSNLPAASLKGQDSSLEVDGTKKLFPFEEQLQEKQAELIAANQKLAAAQQAAQDKQKLEAAQQAAAAQQAVYMAQENLANQLRITACDSQISLSK